jgi:type I restriction enzyme R subunit
LKRLLQENHRYVFSLIHKFNQDVDPRTNPTARATTSSSSPTKRTARRPGKLARNMRLALPNAAFIGFTGTPLFKHDHLTRRIFGSYVSRYDFKRSEEDGATVKLVYENRGEKLGLARLDLNDRIAEAIAKAELDPDKEALLEKLLGKGLRGDHRRRTRLDKLADDFVEHCATRWESGKSMFVCIDKITCARIHQRIMPRWQKKRQLRCRPGAAQAAEPDPQRERSREGWRRSRLDGGDDRRDHHQRRRRTRLRTSGSGASTSSRTAGDEAGFRDRRRQAASMSKPPSRTRSTPSASPSCARCGSPASTSNACPRSTSTSR